MSTINTQSTSKFSLSTLSPSKPNTNKYGKRVFLNSDNNRFLLKSKTLDLKYGLSKWDNSGNISYTLNAYDNIDFFRALETKVKEMISDNSKEWLGMDMISVEQIDNLQILYPVVKSGKAGDNVKFNFPINNGVFSPRVYDSSGSPLELTETNFKEIIPRCKARVCFGVSLFISTSKKVSLTLTTHMIKITEIVQNTVSYPDTFDSDSDDE